MAPARSPSAQPVAHPSVGGGCGRPWSGRAKGLSQNGYGLIADCFAAATGGCAVGDWRLLTGGCWLAAGGCWLAAGG
eukprot:15482888-Alexandrium_andersonii.AAC.1